MIDTSPVPNVMLLKHDWTRQAGNQLGQGGVCLGDMSDLTYSKGDYVWVGGGDFVQWDFVWIPLIDNWFRELPGQYKV